MSRHETHMTLWFWEQISGTLYEEFLVVPPRFGQGRRLIDGLIVTSLPKRRAAIGEPINIEGHDVIVVQTKNSRLGMYLMGQTLFSAELVKRLNPRSIRSIALCARDDAVLRPLLEAYSGCEVHVCPPEICGLFSGSSRPSTAPLNSGSVSGLT